MKRCALALTVLVAACGGGGSGGAGSAAGNPLGANVSGSIQVDARSISFRLSSPGLVSATVVDPVPIPAAPFGGALYVVGVPLSPGSNPIRIRGRMADGSEVEQAFDVQNAPNPHAAVELAASPLVSSTGTATALVASSPHAGIVSVRWDLDGDGALDAESSGLAMPYSYPSPGSYAPTCTIETDAGLLFTSLPDRRKNLIGVLPDEGASFTGTWLAGLAGLGEIHAQPDSGEFFVLSPVDARLYRLGADGSLIASIDLPGVVSPQGFACDENGDLYVADTGNGRVVRLLASNGYSLDQSFGTGGSLGSQGAALGQLDAPQDVALLREVESDALRIGVADLGNARLQVFDEAGSVQLEIRGDEHGGAPLQEPVRLAPAGPYAVAVLDQSGASLRFFDLGGRERSAGGQAAGSSNWTAPTGLASEPTGDGWAVYDAGAVRLLGPELGWVRSFQPGFDVAGMCFQWLGESSMLVLSSGDPGVTGLKLVVLAQDAPGLRPTDVVGDFAAAVAAGNLGQALSSCEPDLAPSLSAIFADPASLAGFQALLSGMGAPQSLDARGDLAQLAFTASYNGGQVDFEWLLARSSQDRRWRIRSL